MIGITQKQSNVLERIWLLAKIEFKLRYYENKLGLLWALIKPLTNLVIYFIAFKVVMKTGTPNFAIYLFSGLIVWEFFVEATTGLTLILQTKKYLYEYSNMSKLEIYLASMISISLGFTFNFAILMLFILFSDIEIGLNMLFLPLHFILFFLFSFGSALILSNIYIKAKDIHQIWPLISHLMMWMSPIFFLDAMLKNGIPFVEYINPMFGIITNFRGSVMYNQPPDFNILLVNVLQTIVVFLIGLFLLKKIGKKASEIL